VTPTCHTLLLVAYVAGAHQSNLACTKGSLRRIWDEGRLQRMTTASDQLYLRRRFPRRASSHVGWDDGAWICRVDIYTGRYVHVLSHRYNSSLPVSWTVWRGTAAFADCLKHWGAHVASFVKRVVPLADGSVASERAVDEDMARDYPALYEYLTLDWLEGISRETATLGVSVDAGQFKARLADRDAGLVTFVSADSFFGVLEALERHLAAGTADWRRDAYAKPKKSPRRS